MKMKRILVALPEPLKRKLDALRSQGYTASGFIRAVLERGIKPTPGQASERTVSDGTCRTKRPRLVE